MKGKLGRWAGRFPRGFFIWAGLIFLLAIGILSSLVDLGSVSKTETLRANHEQQRVIIDAVTGVVAGLKTEEAPVTEFEVADEKPADTSPMPPSEEMPAENENPPTAETGEPPATDMPPAEEAAGTEVVDTQGLTALQRTAEDVGIPQVPRSRDSLIAAPAPEISEKMGDLQVPTRGEKDARPSALYAKPFVRKDQQPLLAIVVTDAGFSDESIRMLLDMKPEITVGVSPYISEPSQKITALRNKGHEVWSMLPAMSSRYPQDDPGPLGLIQGQEKNLMITRLAQGLGATVGSVGVILPVDEALSQTPIWGHVLAELDARGLYILSTHPSRGIENLASTPKQRDIIRRADLVLDSTPSTAFIVSKLAGLKEQAMAKQKMVVLISARPKALVLLGEWLEKNPLGSDVALAPLSAIYAPDEPPPPPEDPEEKKGGH